MDITYNHGDDNHFHGISWKYNVLTNKNMKKYNVDIMVIYLIFVNGFFSGNAPESKLAGKTQSKKLLKHH